MSSCLPVFKTTFIFAFYAALWQFSVVNLSYLLDILKIKDLETANRDLLKS